MTTRHNHGTYVKRRRDTALHNLQERLRTGNHNVHPDAPMRDLQRKLNDKDIARIEAEIDVLKQRGAS